MDATGPALVYETSGEIVPIPAGGLAVGRDPDAGLPIADATVSKHHAEVARQGNAHVVVDLGSRNGTFVNGIQVQTRVLADGDHVRFGTVSFRYRAIPSMVMEPRAADRRLTRALEAIRELSAATVAPEGERAATAPVLDFLVGFLGADRAFVAFVRGGAEEALELAALRTHADAEKRLASTPLAYASMQRAIRDRCTFCPTARLASAVDFTETGRSVRGASLGSILVVPLLSRGRVIGAVQAERHDGGRGPFDEVDVLVAETAANLLCAGIEAARLRPETRAAPASAPVAPA